MKNLSKIAIIQMTQLVKREVNIQMEEISRERKIGDHIGVKKVCKALEL